MKKITICASMSLICSISSLYGAVPVVTNVVAQQVSTSKMVQIHYDLFDADGDLIKIRVEVSDNGGKVYSVPAFNLVGDVGENVQTGVNKRILWDAGADWDGEYSTQMVVKVYAIDNVGFPGLEWGNEVPPSGFLMGQDGSQEYVGPSRHVVIPWSYWMSKYEIRNDQYVDFLNMALVAGDVSRVDTYVVANNFRFAGVPGGSLLTVLDAVDFPRDLRWNVNNFEVKPGRSRFPVQVTWYGALAFAQYYGYDLPTDAEWEKAARGPDHDDEDQHLKYPWGDELEGWNANYLLSGDPYSLIDPPTTPVGYYDGNQIPLGLDTVNGYGLYDVSGNLAEWCRSIYIDSVENYPQVESLSNEINNISVETKRVLRGGSFFSTPILNESLAIYKRIEGNPSVDQSDTGFRVARRTSPHKDPKPVVSFVEGFDNSAVWTATASGNWTVNSASGTWKAGQYTSRIVNSALARSGSGCIGFTNFNSQLYLPAITNGNPGGISFYVREVKSGGAFTSFVQLFERDGASWKQFGETIEITGESYQLVDLNVSSSSVNEFMIFAYRVYLDDVKVITLP